MSLDASSALTAFRRTSTADDVADALRAAVAAGELAQGTPLREAALAARLGVGRAPVREALRALISEGLVLSDVHGAASVKVLSAEDAYDLYVMREAIEPTAVRVIVDTPAIDIRPLLGAFEEMTRAWSQAKPSPELVDAVVSRRPDAPSVLRRHVRASADLILAELEDDHAAGVAARASPLPP